MDKCLIEGCIKIKRKRGWCEMHYSRFKAHGTPYSPAKVVLPAECVEDNCSDKPIAKERCKRHYYQVRNNVRHVEDLREDSNVKSDPPEDKLKEPEKKTCGADKCISDPSVRGWCGAHYQRWRRFGDPNHYGEPINMQCIIEGCERTKNARGLCNPHYYRWNKYGDPIATPVRMTPKLPDLPKRKCITCQEEYDPQGSRVRKYCGRKCAPTKRGGSVNRRVWVEKLGLRDNWICHICGEDVDNKLYWPQIMAGSVDHVIPVKHGGTDVQSNLALAHLTCNTARGDKPLPIQR